MLLVINGVILQFPTPNTLGLKIVLGFYKLILAPVKIFRAFCIIGSNKIRNFEKYCGGYVGLGVNCTVLRRREV